jgi:hypothetical protein
MFKMTLARSLPFTMVKCIAGLMLAGTVLWQVAEHSGSPNGIAYVHVSAPEVDVMIDSATYHVDSPKDSPIVCALRAGEHTLKMTRNGKLLYDEKFTLAEDEERVLTAWERANSAAVDPDHLAGSK